MNLMIDDFPLAAEGSPAPMPVRSPSTPGAAWAAALLVVIAAILVRVFPTAGFTGVGFDEALYRDNVIKLDKVGLIGFPEICQLYLEDQRRPEVMTKLPPTRFLYVFAGWAWKRAEFGDAAPAAPRTPGFVEKDPALQSLHRVSCLFSILSVIVAGLPPSACSASGRC